jgi:hypothetical protein
VCQKWSYFTCKHSRCKRVGLCVSQEVKYPRDLTVYVGLFQTREIITNMHFRFSFLSLSVSFIVPIFESAKMPKHPTTVTVSYIMFVEVSFSIDSLLPDRTRMQNIHVYNGTVCSDRVTHSE